LGASVAGWNVPSDNLTHSFQYPRGIVFPAGYTFNAANVSFFVNGPEGIAGAILQGFLTPIYPKGYIAEIEKPFLLPAELGWERHLRTSTMPRFWLREGRCSNGS
jgi:hypothetical protein